MEYSIENLRGRIIETDNGAKYQVVEFFRAPQFAERGYAFQIQSREMLDSETIEDPKTFLNGTEKFLMHFSPDFKLTDGFFGYEEENYIEYLFKILSTLLDTDLVEFSKNDEAGEVEVYFIIS